MRIMIQPNRRHLILGLGAALAASGNPVRAAPAIHQIEIRRFRFSQLRFEITAGDRVVWINHDAAPHTATDTDGGWDTGQIDRGQSVELIFASPGHYTYVCAFHPQMKAELIVMPA